MARFEANLQQNNVRQKEKYQKRKILKSAIKRRAQSGGDAFVGMNNKKKSLTARVKTFLDLGEISAEESAFNFFSYFERIE